MVNLRRLRYFVAVAEELHFGRAAERLHLAQPPLSRQITALESDLGFRLFRRSRRKVELTAEGRLFLAQARQLLVQAERVDGVAKQVRRGEAGRIEIAYASSVPFTDIFRASVKEFARRYPDVTLVFSELASNRQFDALGLGTCDVGFLRPFRSRFPAGVQLETILREPLLVALPLEHPLTRCSEVPISSLAHEPFILFPQAYGSGLYNQVVSLCLNAGFMPAVRQEAAQMTAIIALVSAGQGISIVPASTQHALPGEVAYRPLSGVSEQAELGLAHRVHERSAAVRNFIALAAG